MFVFIVCDEESIEEQGNTLIYTCGGGSVSTVFAIA